MIVRVPHGSFNISALCPSDVPAPRESIKICALLYIYRFVPFNPKYPTRRQLTSCYTSEALGERSACFERHACKCQNNDTSCKRIIDVFCTIVFLDTAHIYSSDKQSSK